MPRNRPSDARYSLLGLLLPAICALAMRCLERALLPLILPRDVRVLSRDERVLSRDVRLVSCDVRVLSRDVRVLSQVYLPGRTALSSLARSSATASPALHKLTSLHPGD
eukprot:517669-Rhodomonas_salina.2